MEHRIAPVKTFVVRPAACKRSEKKCGGQKLIPQSRRVKAPPVLAA
jgi:hypothetical protein